MMTRTENRRKTIFSRSLLGAFVAVGLMGAAPAMAKAPAHHQPSTKQTHAKLAGNKHVAAKHGASGKHLAKHVTHLNCVQYVQHATNVGLHGDAGDWWDNAEGIFGRGEAPKSGAIMVFSRTSNLPYGHVAVVRQVLNKRSILIDHANWSPIRGRRGQVEKAVQVVDVSADNDWSEVRVWYAPTKDIGQTVYPLNGFIYTHKDVPHHIR